MRSKRIVWVESKARQGKMYQAETKHFIAQVVPDDYEGEEVYRINLMKWHEAKGKYYYYKTLGNALQDAKDMLKELERDYRKGRKK